MVNRIVPRNRALRPTTAPFPVIIFMSNQDYAGTRTARNRKEARGGDG
jgi:hypothetical protein